MLENESGNMVMPVSPMGNTGSGNQCSERESDDCQDSVIGGKRYA